MAIYKIISIGQQIVAEQSFMDLKHPGDYILITNNQTTSVPQSVNAAQFMMALSQQSYYQTVLNYINTLPIADQLAFNHAPDFYRNDSLLNTLAPNIPITSAQLDELFIAAAAINV